IVQGVITMLWTT
nr:immunoglobulin heavy chain junction region [Mus musculus]